MVIHTPLNLERKPGYSFLPDECEIWTAQEREFAEKAHIVTDLSKI
jgi:hypothetical protein